MPDDAVIARRLMIRGRVQGVSYRANAVAVGEQLGLSGWVRNRRDGSVEAVVSGPARVVAEFIAWAHEGPPAAHVTEVELSEVAAPEDGPFSMRPTA